MTTAIQNLNRFQIPPFPVWRFTIDEYHRLIELGAFTEDDPVELLEGWLAPRVPRNPPHDGCIQCLSQCIGGLLPAGWTLRIQSAVTSTDSEPEPDLAVVRGDARTYMTGHPGPADIGMIVEVSDTSLATDRNDKGRIYARMGVPVYWIVHLVDRQVEVYTNPTGIDAGAHYANRQDFGVHQQVPVELDGKRIGSVSVDALLP